VYPTVIAHLKRPLLEGAPAIFSAGQGTNGRRKEEITAPPHKEIGRLKMEVDWLKKSFEPAGGEQTSMDRPRPSPVVDRPAVSVVGMAPLELRLRADGDRNGSEPAADRRVVPEASVLWLAAHDRLAAAAGMGGQRETGGASDAGDGVASRCAWATYESATSDASGISFLLEGLGIGRPDQVGCAEIT